MTPGDLAVVVGCPIGAVIAIYKIITSTSVGPWWLLPVGVGVIWYVAARHEAKHQVPFRDREPSPWRDRRPR